MLPPKLSRGTSPAILDGSCSRTRAAVSGGVDSNATSAGVSALMPLLPASKADA